MEARAWLSKCQTSYQISRITGMIRGLRTRSLFNWRRFIGKREGVRMLNRWSIQNSI
jgi:hypothetical protein